MQLPANTFSYGDYIAVYAGVVATLTAAWTIWQNMNEKGAAKIDLNVAHIIPTPPELDTGEFGKNPLLIVVRAVNTGKFPITFNGWYMTHYDPAQARTERIFKRVVSFFKGNASLMFNRFILPRKLDHSDTVSVYHPRVDMISQNVRSMFLSDTTGKMHRVGRRALGRAIKKHSGAADRRFLRFWL